MIKKSTRLAMLLAVMLTVLVVVALALSASGVPRNGNDNITDLGKQNVFNGEIDGNSNKTSSSNFNRVKIYPAEAQQIAKKFIKEPRAKVGIPMLDEIDGQMVYMVPIIINGTNVGEININALTGENMGGAGGLY